MTGQLYRAVWRWHFYAGLLTLPVLALLALTGGLYLFKPEIHHLLYREMIEVTPRASAPAPASVLRASVEAAMQGRVVQLTLPARNDRSVEALVRVPGGDVRNAYIDPYDARVLGSTEAGGAMQVVKQLHSLTLIAPWANAIVEIAAGWAVIMVFTGIYLWWPRGAKGGVLTVRGKPAHRTFWRDLHAVTGVLAGAVIVFLAVTGMPWSMVWGSNVHKWVAVSGLGAPRPPQDVTPRFLLTLPVAGGGTQGHETHGGIPERPWGLQKVPVPHSHAAGGQEIGIDAAAARFEALGVLKPYGLQPPESEKGAYAANYTPDKIENIRLVYLDQYSGELISETRYADYGPGAKAIEWGIFVHQGLQYGEVNRVIMLAGCIAILALAVSAVTMWWKRRPRGSLGAPPRGGHAERFVLGAIAVVGVLYPLTGLSFLAAVAIDAVVARLRRA
jgi:uncharacterized iron-regulated membrane protein